MPMTFKLKSKKQSKDVLINMVFIFFFLFISLLLIYLEESRQVQRDQSFFSEISDYAAVIDHRINEAFYALYTLSFVIQQSEGHLKEFDQTAEQLTRYNSYIDQVGMAPNGVISEVTRREGQSRHLHIGINLFDDNSFANAALLAKEKNHIVMTPLLHNHDAKPYVVGLLPINLKNKNGEGAFWGFALIAIDIGQLLHSPPIFEKAFVAQYHPQILFESPSGVREIIYTDVKSTVNNALEFPILSIVDGVNVHLKDGQWLLTITPRFIENRWVVLLRNIFISFVSILVLWIIAKKRLVCALIEEEKRNYFERYALISKTSLVFETDAQGRFVYASEKFCQISGYTQEELIGKTPRIIKSDQHTAQQYKEFWDTIKSGVIWNWELCNKAKNGSLFWVNTTIVPIIDSRSNEIEGYFSVMMDITERKKDQDEKEKLQMLLNQSQRLESIGQLASGIAHDFNNILMPIMGFARLALVFCRNNEPERAIPCLEKVQVSSQRAAELVDKMLIFAREKTIKAEYPILPSIVVDEVVKIGKMLRSGISATIDISMNNALTDASPLILIDPSELHQIMTNLIVNARDAIEEAQLDRPGGGKIEVGLYVDSIKESDDVYCNVCSHELQGDYVVISVQDTGTGIKSEDLMRLFNPFFTTKDVGKGTGLGLSVVSGILHGADAHIQVLSQLGQGTTFRLLFPAVYQSDKVLLNTVQEIECSEESLNHKDGQFLRVCVIDDEQDICELLKEELTCLGYLVKTFDNSLIAADYLRDNLDEIDAVITDYGMPNLTGLELAIAVLKMRPQLPILFCTGYSDKLKSKADLPEGNTFLFRKPLDTKVLDKTIKEFFNK